MHIKLSITRIILLQFLHELFHAQRFTWTGKNCKFHYSIKKDLTVTFGYAVTCPETQRVWGSDTVVRDLLAEGPVNVHLTKVGHGLKHQSYCNVCFSCTTKTGLICFYFFNKITGMVYTKGKSRMPILCTKKARVSRLLSWRAKAALYRSLSATM